MALHEIIGWILRLELLWVGCVKFGSIGADIVEEKTTCTRGSSLRSIDALLTLIEMTGDRYGALCPFLWRGQLRRKYHGYVSGLGWSTRTRTRTFLGGIIVIRETAIWA